MVLTKDMKLALSPRFYSPAVENVDGTITTDNRVSRQRNTDAMNLVFLTSRHGFDTHSGCLAMGRMNISHIFNLYHDTNASETNSLSTTTIVVDEVWAPSTATTETKRRSETNQYCRDTVAGMSFPGFFLQQLPQSCFLSSECILVTTQWGSCQKVVLVSILTGTVRLISIPNGHPYSSDELLFCNHIGAMICTKTPNQPARVHFIAADQLLASTDHSTATTDTVDTEQSMTVSSTGIGTFASMASSKIALLPGGRQPKNL